MRNQQKRSSPSTADKLIGALALLGLVAYASWWVFDRATNQEYYSVLGQKESVIKTNYEKLRMVSHQNAEGLPLDIKKQIKDEISRREDFELRQAKEVVDRQFGRK